MDSIQLLISDYLEGELSDDELHRLTDLLQTDSDALDRFVFNGFIHSQLLDWMDQEPIKTLPFEADLAAPSSSRVIDASPPSNAAQITESRDPARDSRRTRVIWTVAAMAATLLITATISMVTRPRFVGQLTDVVNCRWRAEQAAISLGTPLYDGQELNLIQGNAVVTFASGAKMLLEGPTSLRLDSPKAVQLTAGRIAVKVPRQATGFAVNSSLARFVDLGTEFTVKLEPEKTFELYVFEGMVEMQLDERFGNAARKPVYVPEVRAYHFDIKVGDVEPLPFNQGEKMPF